MMQYNIRILLVDDDPQILKSLGRHLRGNKVFFANGLQSALDILCTETIDLVISDYYMPGGDGVTLLKHIQKRFPTVHRVLMSADPPSQLSELTYTGLIERFLPKPFSINMVHSLIRWDSTVEHVQPKELSSEPNLRRTGACYYDFT